MKIIDTFLFSEEHEADILRCKLEAEAEFVDQFIAVESTHDFRGNYKGCHLYEILEDATFNKFREKIHIIQLENQFREDWPQLEHYYFKVEFASRAAVHEQLLYNHLKDEDWIILSDVDEMVDFADARKRDIMWKILNSDLQSFQIRNDKFWFDFNNLNLMTDKYIPFHRFEVLNKEPSRYSNRNNLCPRQEPKLTCAVEYAYCFSLAGNWSKLNTFAHDRYTKDNLIDALKVNTWHKSPERNESLNYPLDFFETIELTPDNSTEFVRENLDKLLVNTVSPDYAENRRMRFQGCYPHPCFSAGLMRGNKIRDDRNYFKREN